VNNKDLTYLYYQNVFGCYPFNTDNNKIITELTIQHLLDNEIEEEKILKEIIKVKDGYIAPNNIPSIFWKDSLLNKDIFYTHKLLQLTSKPPKLDKNKIITDNSKFYIEMKIQFTIEDLYEYYINWLKRSILYTDKKKDIGGFNYMLLSYSKIQYITSIDIILKAIDYAKDKSYLTFTSSIQLKDVIDNCILKDMIYKNSLGYKNGYHTIIWRSDKMEPDKITVDPEYLLTQI